MKTKILFVILLLTLLTACASETPAAAQNGIEIYQPVAMAAKTGETTGAFMTIKNTGSAADQLVGAACEAAMMTQVHETVMKGDVMTMNEVPAIEIPAGQMVELRHGSYHIMLMDLMQEIKAGEMTKCTLKFATAGELTVSIMVMSR